MKSKNITITLLSLLWVMLFSGTIALNTLNVFKTEPLEESEILEATEIKDFNGILVTGYWKLIIRKGKEQTVTLQYPKNAAEQITTKVTNGIFELSNHNHQREGVSSRVFSETEHFIAKITIPSLSKLHASGINNVQIIGFDEKNLNLTLSGAGSIKAKNTRVENLKVHQEGSGNITFLDAKVVNATLLLEGFGSITVNMDGGFLDADNDFGTIRYSGTISQKKFNTSGSGVIIKMN